MKLTDIIARSFRNLARAKLRTFLTIIAIVVGAFTLSLTTSLGEGVKKVVDDQTKLIAVNGMMIITGKIDGRENPAADKPVPYDPNKTGRRGIPLLTDDDLNKINAISGIEKSYRLYSVSAEYVTTPNHDKYEISLTPLGGIEDFELTTTAGKMPSSTDTGYMIITSKYLDALGLGTAEESIGKTVTVVFKNLTGEELTKEYRIAAVVPNSFVNGGSSYISYEESKTIADFQEKGSPTAGKFTAVLSKYDTSLKPAAIQSIKNQLSDKGYQGQTVEDQIATIKGAISVIQIVLGAFGVIAILASVFGIVNTLLMGVYERIKEIGLMKALGMSKFNIFLMFSIEAMMIGFWGGVIGGALSYGAATIGNFIFKRQNFFGFENIDILIVQPLYVGLIIVGLMIVSFLAGVLPSRKAANMDPIEALRTE